MTSPPSRYALGLALLAVAVALSVAFRDTLEPHVFLFFTGVVVLTAWLAGLGPSVTVSVLAVVAADLLFIDPLGRVGGDPPRGLVGLVVFLLISALVASVTAGLRRARAEAERRQAELERVLRSRDRLVRGFSHDVKNPLSAAHGQLALMLEGMRGELTAEQRETAERIRDAIGDAVSLIDDVVELSRAEAGQLETERAPVDVRAVVLALADVHRGPADAKGLTLEADVPDALPTIESDERRIRQILGNLLSNGLKYTPEGGRISVRAAARTETGRDGEAPGPGEWLAIEVSDTGPGIPADQRPLLFREFARLSPEAGPGAGLGLAISRRIARLLGGDITVESEVGVGSTFTLWLPVAPPPPPPPPATGPDDGPGGTA